MGNLDHFGNNNNVVHLAVYHKNEIKKTVFFNLFFIIKFLLLSQKILSIITAIVCLIKSLGNLSSSFQIKGKKQLSRVSLFFHHKKKMCTCMRCLQNEANNEY